MAEGGIDNNLETFRQRVKCPICLGILTEPKRLTNCSHVLCLECLRRYLRSKQPINFPTCPVCRKGITISLREIHKFEPARAEADIVPVVKSYELCGFCKKNKNPKNKCVDCGKFICDNCRSCHALLKPNHAIEAIILTSDSNQQVSEICTRHRDQSLDLFCVMCQTLMCLYCEKYSHAKCRDKYHKISVIKRYSNGLLLAFAQGSGERRYLLKSGSIDRIVYVREFATESRKWLEKILIDLGEAVEFYEKYKFNLTEIIDKDWSTESEINNRFQKITEEANTMLECAKYLHSKCTALHETSNDTEVVRIILNMEEICLSFFMLRVDHYLFVRPLKLTFESVGCVRWILKTVSSCHIIEIMDSFACLVCTKYPELEAPNVSSTIEFKENDGTKHYRVISSLSKKIHDRNNTIFNRVVTIDKGNLQDYRRFYQKYELCYEFQMALNLSNSCTYIDSPVIQTYADFSQNTLRASCQHFGRRAASCFPWCFYVESANDNDDPRICFRVGGKHGENYASLDTSLFYTSHFTNVYGQIFNLAIENTQEANIESSTVNLTAIIGKRAPFSGLETLFIYFDDNVSNIYAISISSSIAKFNLVDYIDPVQDKDMTCHLITDELGIFSICNVADSNDSLCTTTFRSQLNTEGYPENFISSIPFSEHPVPMIALNVDLLCYRKMTLYFVKRELPSGKFIIGKLIKSPISGVIEEEHIQVVHQTDINIHIRSLKPLTLVENRNKEVVVICSVEHRVDKTSSQFLMIWPGRDGTGAVELLQIQHSANPNIAIGNGTVLDAEMDPDGQIMFVVEHNDGKKYCAYTKHFMP